MTVNNPEKIESVFIVENGKLIEVEHVSSYAKRHKLNETLINTKRHRNRLKDKDRYVRGGFYFEKKEEMYDKTDLPVMDKQLRRKHND